MLKLILKVIKWLSFPLLHSWKKNITGLLFKDKSARTENDLFEDEYIYKCILTND